MYEITVICMRFIVIFYILWFGLSIAVTPLAVSGRLRKTDDVIKLI